MSESSRSAGAGRGRLRRRHTDPRGDYLHEVVAQLWPGCEVQPGRAAGGASYVLVPNAARPTVMVPRRPRRATAAVLRNYKASGTPGTQAVLLALSLAARVGLTDLLPGRLTIQAAHDADTLETYLGAALAHPVVLAAYTSPPRANRKPVLQVLTAAGRTFGFVKVGTNPLTSDLVAREAMALRALGARRLSHVEVPVLLHHGTWHGLEVLVQQALPRSGGATLAPAGLAVAMAEVAEVKGTEAHDALANDYVHGLGKRLAALPDTEDAAGLRAQFDALAQVPEDEPITLASWHGDWTPWNMTTDGTVARVWDWERFEYGVPLGFDALHFDVQGAIVRAQQDATDACRAMVRRAPQLLAPFGVPDRLARRTALLYLLEIGCRYLHDGQADAGSKRGRLGTWLLPALAGELSADGAAQSPGVPAR